MHCGICIDAPSKQLPASSATLVCWAATSNLMESFPICGPTKPFCRPPQSHAIKLVVLTQINNFWLGLSCTLWVMLNCANAPCQWLVWPTLSAKLELPIIFLLAPWVPSTTVQRCGIQSVMIASHWPEVGKSRMIGWQNHLPRLSIWNHSPNHPPCLHGIIPAKP